VEILGSNTGVATRFGVRSGGGVSHPEREETVAQGRWFTGGEDDAELGERETECADELDEFPVAQAEGGIGLVAVVPRVRAEARKGDCELGLPAVSVEVFEVSSEGECFRAPGGQPEECADPDPAETPGVGPLGTVEAPVKVLLGSCGMQLGVAFAVIGLLVDYEAFRSAGDQLRVLGVFHGADFDSKGGNKGCEAVQALLEVSLGYEFRVLPSDQKEIPEALAVQMSCLCFDLVRSQGGPQDGVVP